jgi:transketolase
MDHGNMKEGYKGLHNMAATMRRWIIQQSFDSNVGHIGSALSIVEIMTVLWGRVMRDAGTESPYRDRFILAKGHASLALYCALRLKDLLDEVSFCTYCKDGSLLGIHPEHAIPGIDLSTGSLGQGLSVGCGLAFGFRIQELTPRVYVLLSDAECNEGQVWEAAMFAAHHQLSNLTAVVDYNGIQALGSTKDILDLSPLEEKWRAFGWNVVGVDGHDIDLLTDALLPVPSITYPRIVIARTILGKGVSFMEDNYEWHYLNLTSELAARALDELEGKD